MAYAAEYYLDRFEALREQNAMLVEKMNLITSRGQMDDASEHSLFDPRDSEILSNPLWNEYQIYSGHLSGIAAHVNDAVKSIAELVTEALQAGVSDLQIFPIENRSMI